MTQIVSTALSLIAYNLAFPELHKILGGEENDMIPVEAWA